MAARIAALSRAARGASSPPPSTAARAPSALLAGVRPDQPLLPARGVHRLHTLPAAAAPAARHAAAIDDRAQPPLKFIHRGVAN